MIRVLTEDVKEENVLLAIFQEEVSGGLVSVQSFMTSSATLASAEYSLLTRRDCAVALVVNSNDWSEEEVEDERATIHRILHRAAPVGWHVSIAQPSVDAWIMADPAIRAIFEAKEATRSNPSQRAREIGEVAARHPIDREAIARAHPDFRSLVEFIAAHSRAPEAVA